MWCLRLSNLPTRTTLGNSKIRTTQTSLALAGGVFHGQCRSHDRPTIPYRHTFFGRRLAQIAIQSSIERSGAANAISSDELATKLKLTNDQKQELKKRSKEIEKKLAEEIARLKREAKEELLEVLSADQRATLQDLTGDHFRMHADDWKQAMENHSKMTR